MELGDKVWSAGIGANLPQDGQIVPAYATKGNSALITYEDLYQAIKARLVAELLVDVHGAPNYGRLFTKEDK